MYVTKMLFPIFIQSDSNIYGLFEKHHNLMKGDASKT